MEEVAGVGTFTASLLTRPEIIEKGWATAPEVAAMADAWREWSRTPGAFLARFWVEAVGWAE